MRFGHIRSHSEELAVAVNGFLESSEFPLCATDRDVRIDEVVLQRERLPVARQCILRPVQLLQRVAQIQVHLGALGRQYKRGLITRDGLIKLPETVQRGAEVIVCVGRVGFERERATKARYRLLDAASLKFCDPQVVLCFGVLWQQTSRTRHCLQCRFALQLQ